MVENSGVPCVVRKSLTPYTNDTNTLLIEEAAYLLKPWLLVDRLGSLKYLSK